MAKDRFSSRIGAWMPPDLADVVERLAEEQMTTSSTVIRQALKFYLSQLGVLPVRPAQPNGNGKAAGARNHA